MTTEPKHTPEPWYAEEQEARAHIFAKHIGMDCHVAKCFGPNPADVHEVFEIARANAARIVACVNACAGIPTEQLEAGCVERLVRAARQIHMYGKSKEAWESLGLVLAGFQKDPSK